MRKATDPDRLKADILKAMRLRRPMTLTYTRANGSVTVRTVEPYMFTKNADKDPYFRAMDRESTEPRTFRLDRIVAYTVHGNKSRHLLTVPESKPKSGVPTAAETKRAAVYAREDIEQRPTPLTVARRLPARTIAVRPLHQSPLAGVR